MMGYFLNTLLIWTLVQHLIVQLIFIWNYFLIVSDFFTGRLFFQTYRLITTSVFRIEGFLKKECGWNSEENFYAFVRHFKSHWSAKHRQFGSEFGRFKFRGLWSTRAAFSVMFILICSASRRWWTVTIQTRLVCLYTKRTRTKHRF